MKKNKKISVAALALVGIIGATSIGVFANAKAENKTVAPRSVVLADFEDFKDVQSLTWVNQHLPIGTYNWSDKGDSKAIDGRSLVIEAEGSVAENWAGYAKDSGRPVCIAYDVRTPVKNGGAWGFDWKYLDKLSVEVNNANDFELRASMYVQDRSGFPLCFGTTTIPANTTSTLEVNVSRYAMQTEFESYVFSTVNFMFNYDKKVLTEEECTPCEHATQAECKAANCISRRYDYSKAGDLYYPKATIYVDNLTAEVNENSIYAENGSLIVDKKFESATEILNFNQSADLEYVFETAENYVKEADNDWATRYWDMGTGSAVYYNSNEKYVHEGNVGSLEWRLAPTLQSKYSASNYTYCTDFNYLSGYFLTGFTVAAPYLNYYNFSSLQSGNVKICVDVYNACGYDKEVSFGIHDMSGVATELKTSYPYNYNAYGPTDVWTKLPAGEWTTLEISDFSKIDLSKGLARLRLNTSVFDVVEPVSFYVNNLRIEYVGKEA